MILKKLFIVLAFCLYATLSLAEALNINAATADEIAEMMAGVGKAKAEAIIKDRELNGEFKSIEELTRVKGIGLATVEKNQDKITVK